MEGVRPDYRRTVYNVRDQLQPRHVGYLVQVTDSDGAGMEALMINLI